MNGLILYIIKSVLYTSAFQSFYLLIMRKTTFLRLNRIVFITGTLICLILPFINIGRLAAGEITTPIEIIESVLVSDTLMLDEASISADTQINRTALIIKVLFIIGAFASFLITTISYIRMCKMIRSAKPVEIDGAEVRIIDEEIPSFSWGRHIVIGKRDLEENPAILTHERMHVRCRHSYDLMAYTIVTTLQWFNPLVWIARTELKMLHEYEADELTINKGIDATQYQLLLVKKAVGNKRFQLANGFNHSKLKNRITMMHKNKTNRMMKLAYILCIPALIGVMCCCAHSTEAGNIAANETISGNDATVNAELKASRDTTAKKSPMPFSLVDVKPTFNGGDANAFSKWVNEHLAYPESCKKAGIGGRVVLSFTVSENGKVTDVKVLRGVHEDLDKEAVRVLGMAPDWTPGMVDGKPVAVSYTFPIIYHSRKDEDRAFQTDERSDVVPFQFAGTKPGFNGGDANEFSKWVAENLVYPENCKKEGIGGRVTLSFTITATGKLIDVKVLRGANEELDKEAVRVVSSSPDWTPGAVDGKPVAVSYTFPVIFKANGTDKATE